MEKVILKPGDKVRRLPQYNISAKFKYADRIYTVDKYLPRYHEVQLKEFTGTWYANRFELVESHSDLHEYIF